MVFSLQFFEGLSQGVVTRWVCAKSHVAQVGPVIKKEFPNGLCVHALSSLEEQRFSFFGGTAFSPLREGSFDGKQARPFSSAVTWGVGWALPCSRLRPPPFTVAPLVAAPSFPSLTLGSLLRLSIISPLCSQGFLSKTQTLLLKILQPPPITPGESPHFFFFSIASFLL